MRYLVSKKNNFCSPFIWKKIFFFQKNFIFKLSEKFCFDRSSRIPSIYNRLIVHIYSGKIWHTRKITKWSVGFKFGEFTWNKKRAVFKAKQLKKKKLKLSRNSNV